MAQSSSPSRLRVIFLPPTGMLKIHGGRSEEFSGGNANITRRHQGGLFLSCHNEGAPGQMVGFSEETAGSLMDGGDGCRFKG
nr:hypothetical protein [Desulfobulbaceae bacterium]